MGQNICIEMILTLINGIWGKQKVKAVFLE